MNSLHPRVVYNEFGHLITLYVDVCSTFIILARLRRYNRIRSKIVKYLLTGLNDKGNYKEPLKTANILENTQSVQLCFTRDFKRKYPTNYLKYQSVKKILPVVINIF